MRSSSIITLLTLSLGAAAAVLNMGTEFQDLSLQDQGADPTVLVQFATWGDAECSAPPQSFMNATTSQMFNCQNLASPGHACAVNLWAGCNGTWKSITVSIVPLLFCSSSSLYHGYIADRELQVTVFFDANCAGETSENVAADTCFVTLVEDQDGTPVAWVQSWMPTCEWM
jgi:hypothetical protein